MLWRGNKQHSSLRCRRATLQGNTVWPAHSWKSEEWKPKLLRFQFRRNPSRIEYLGSKLLPNKGWGLNQFTFRMEISECNLIREVSAGLYTLTICTKSHPTERPHLLFVFYWLSPSNSEPLWNNVLEPLKIHCSCTGIYSRHGWITLVLPTDSVGWRTQWNPFWVYDILSLYWRLKFNLPVLCFQIQMIYIFRKPENVQQCTLGSRQ